MRLELHAGKLARAVLRGGGSGNADLLTRHRAPDAQGLPGTPSLYLVQDRRYGWSWRCLSSNCAFCAGPMKHSFRLFQELRGLSAAAALAEACERWTEAQGEAGGDGRGGGREKAGSETEDADWSGTTRGGAEEEDEEAQWDRRPKRRSGDDD